MGVNIQIVKNGNNFSKRLTFVFLMLDIRRIFFKNVSTAGSLEILPASNVLLCNMIPLKTFSDTCSIFATNDQITLQYWIRLSVPAFYNKHVDTMSGKQTMIGCPVVQFLKIM